MVLKATHSILIAILDILSSVLSEASFTEWMNVFFFSHSPDIDAQIRELQGKRKILSEEPDKQTAVGLDSTGYYDQEIYGGSDSRFKGYVTSIAANEQEEVFLKNR